MSSEPRAFRGYIASRPVRGMRVPQRIQNLLVRDYAQRHDMRFLLSATEYVMPSCYMILQGVLDELPAIAGIVAFSIFMLPVRRERRLAIYERVLGAVCEFHAALENVSVTGPEGIARCEDLIAIAGLLPSAPFGASMERLEGGVAADAGIRALLGGSP